MPATIHQFPPARKPLVYRLNRGVRYARPVPWPAAQVATDLLTEFGASAQQKAQDLAAGQVVQTIWARYATDPAAFTAAHTPADDARPLWAQIADPAHYEGTDRRGTLVQGRY